MTEHQGCRRIGCEPDRSHTAGTVGNDLRMGPRARFQQEEHSDLLLELGLIEDVGFMSFSPRWAEATRFKEVIGCWVHWYTPGILAQDGETAGW